MFSHATRANARFAIRLATSHDELEQIYHFRYRIYVEEMQRKQHYADHVRRRIRDPLDDFAINLAAWDPSGNIVGVVRANKTDAGDLGNYERFYEMETAGSAHPTCTSITTRFMVSQEYRHTTLAARLAIAVYEYGLVRGITFNFIDCNDHLVPLFKGLGFVQYLPKKYHEEYGAVTCMRLSVLDRTHLKNVSSPFLASLNRWQRVGQKLPAVAVPAPA
jgi:hypothetical protein